MSQMVRKEYLRIQFRTASPLSVGSGANDLTDRDIIRSCNGQPMIPGTALAGIYRRLFALDQANQYFGPLIEGSKGSKNEAKDSQIVVYDAMTSKPVKEDAVLVRDMVALDDYKTAIKGAKFDFQAVTTGTLFVTYIERNVPDTEAEEGAKELPSGPMLALAQAWKSGAIKVGGKTGRGYGALEVEEIRWASFQLKHEQNNQLVMNQDGIFDWLTFEMYDKADKYWSVITDKLPVASGQHSNAAVEITLQLQLQGGLSIRKYSTRVGEADYEQLTVQFEEDSKSVTKAVIPGTSWAGAFRAQLKKLDPSFDKQQQSPFFGAAKSEDKDGKKTCVSFSESQLEGGHMLQTTRNAIDRFTNSTLDGALYTERTWVGGTTTLKIQIETKRIGTDEDTMKRFYRLLSAACADLHEGIMAVGGLTAVGRGLFRVSEVIVTGTDGSVRTAKFAASGTADESETQLYRDGAGLYQCLAEALIAQIPAKTEEVKQNEQ